MASCKNDFLCILVKVLIIATYGEYCVHLRKSLLWKFLPQPYSNVGPFCVGKKPLFFLLFFSQELSIVQDISFGTTHRYTMLWWVNKHTISRWYCTLVCNFLGSLFHYLQTLYKCNSYSVQNESLHLMLRFIICSLLFIVCGLQETACVY